jgi:nitrate reductase NapE component
MHWLAYRIEEDRVVWLRIVRADQRPADVDVINNGFHSEQEALGLMAHYLRTNDAGFLTIPSERAGEHVNFLRRIALAYHIEPLLLWAVVGSYGLIVLVLALLLAHMIMG